jgi:hypothetical protein
MSACNQILRHFADPLDATRLLKKICKKRKDSAILIVNASDLQIQAGLLSGLR